MRSPGRGCAEASPVPTGGTSDREGSPATPPNLVTQTGGTNFRSMKVGLTAHEPCPIRAWHCIGENVQKIWGFCPGTAILHELDLRVAVGAIRETQST